MLVALLRLAWLEVRDTSIIIRCSSMSNPHYLVAPDHLLTAHGKVLCGTLRIYLLSWLANFGNNDCHKGQGQNIIVLMW